MAKTELKLKSKNVATGQDITTTLSYVNPNADSATLKTFGQKLNAFTTNNYVETDRVQTINVDTEEVPQQTQIGTLDIIDNPAITKGANAAYIPFNNLIINGETYNDLPSGANAALIFGMMIIGANFYSVSISTMSGDNNDSLIIRGVTSSSEAPVSGTGTIRLALAAFNGYTATTMTKSITLP